MVVVLRAAEARALSRLATCQDNEVLACRREWQAYASMVKLIKRQAMIAEAAE